MTDVDTNDAVQRRVARWFPSLADRKRYQHHTDASGFYRVEYGDVLSLAGRSYLILNNAKEGRFGLDDQEKFWVKRAVDLESGQRKIIKLVFYEKFSARIGQTVFDCFRSPRKEARILAKVAEHPNFMHGFATTDSRENIIRVPNIVFHHRLANLKKVYAYIPESLNRILMHFSIGASWHYEHVEQLLEDLDPVAR